MLDKFCDINEISNKSNINICRYVKLFLTVKIHSARVSAKMATLSFGFNPKLRKAWLTTVASLAKSSNVLQ